MIRRPTAQRASGIVLVGTHPWTNSAFDRLLPRTLLPVAHRPLLSFALSWLHAAGIEEGAVCANRETQSLQSRLLRHVPSGMRVTYHEDSMPRGAAGALRDAAGGSDADTFIVTDGTSIPNVDIAALLDFHQSSGALVTVVVNQERGRHGNPCLHVPSGTYVCSREALEGVPTTGFFDLKENLIPQLYRSGGSVLGYVAPGTTPRVLDASSYMAINEWMVERLTQSDEVLGDYVRTGACLRHSDARVSDSALLVGPVMVEAGAEIGPGAVIVGPTSIGRDASVGAGALVSRSAIWRRSSLGEQSVTDRCILADDAVVPARSRAFRTVMFAHFRDVTAAQHSARRLTDPVPSDLLRRMRRAFTGAALSRSPAPQ
jgi:mannose-1-phosphate guanylyltransferase